jgi:hypothetical protein
MEEKNSIEKPGGKIRREKGKHACEGSNSYPLVSRSEQA